MIDEKVISFTAGTPKQLRDVIVKCIEEKTLVHVLTGSPLTGVVTPSIYGVGTFVLAQDNKTLLFKAKRYFHRDGRAYDTWGEEYKSLIVNSMNVLKITEVDSCKLLYQNYECQCRPLTFVHEITLNALDDKIERAYIRCNEPLVEINVPVNINVKVMVQHLFGQVHLLDKGWLGLDEDDGKSVTG